MDQLVNKAKFHDGNGGSSWTEWSKFMIHGHKRHDEDIAALKDKISVQEAKIKVLQMQMAGILFVAGLLATGVSDYIIEFVKKGFGG